MEIYKEYKIPFYKPWIKRQNDFLNRAKEILKSGRLTKGIYLQEFEYKISQTLGVKHVICVSSGTLALFLTLKAFDFKKDSKVILPSFSYISDLEVVLWAGLIPIFVDINPATLSIDVEKTEYILKKEKDVSCVIALHTFGNPAAIRELEYLASKYKFFLIFDASGGFYAMYRKKFIGNFGDAEIFSLSPTKLPTSAEGGIITTNNTQLYKKLLILRDKFGRLSELHALLGIISLPHLKEANQKKNKLVLLYKDLLKGYFEFQETQKDSERVWGCFSILAKDIIKIQEKLNSLGIETKRYFYPLHKGRNFKFYDLSNTEYIWGRILQVPLFVKMQEKQLQFIAKTLINNVNKQTSQTFDCYTPPLTL